MEYLIMGFFAGTTLGSLAVIAYHHIKDDPKVMKSNREFDRDKILKRRQ